MTHNLNHREPPVQKAGQTGTALPSQPLPSNQRLLWHSHSWLCALALCSNLSIGKNACATGDEVLAPQGTGGAVRVAGGESVSKKTSTAALVFLSHGPSPQPAPHTAPPSGPLSTAFTKRPRTATP
jgi:hypothetical protein